ncbi:MAG: D-alanyl-D-alanine carboxypeptidase family protein, partial [Haloferula sp.]
LSGFRSLALQESIFFDVASERNQTAEERAQVSAPPGYSEHSTGYAVDLGDGRHEAVPGDPVPDLIVRELSILGIMVGQGLHDAAADQLIEGHAIEINHSP